MSIIQGTSKGSGAVYEIENSLRLDGTGDMSRSVGSDGNLREWSWSFWVKRSGLGTNGGLGFNIGGTYLNASNRSIVRFYSSGNGTDDFLWAEYVGGAWKEDQWTDAQYRDPSAWSHILLVWNTDGGTTPRARRYINGVQVTELGSSPAAAANADSATNKSGTFQLFDQAGYPGREFEGYCAEMHFVDGTALAPTDFGEFNTDGVWIPIKTSGITYGSNGFYLDFADSSALGNDVSGNNNDFTSSGLATTDQMLDTPTNNFSIFSPIASCNVSGQALTISDGNLRTSAGGTSNAIEAITQIGPSSGKWYAEFTLNAAPQLSNQYPVIGVIGADLNITGGNNVGNSTFRGYVPNGTISGGASYGDTFGNGDVIGVALDLDNQKIWFSKNGTYQNSGDPAAGSNAAFTNLTDGLFYRFCISHAGSTATDVTGNFGASAFATAAPTGFLALNTANLPTPSITDGSAYFQPTLYTGTGSSQAVSQAGNSTFQPDWVWIKGRSGATEHVLTDAVRGVTKELSTNDAGNEETVAQGLTTFGSAGFTVGTDGSYNTSSATYVGWQWKANGSGSSNEDGSINTTATSANTTAGFSVSTYTGNATVGATVGHGLGIAPKVVIVKSRSGGSAESWVFGHDSVGWTKAMYMQAITAPYTLDIYWNNTAPTSSVVTLHDHAVTNGSSYTYVMYAFAEIPGYSSFGSYTGNGSTGTGGVFVHCGFTPAMVILKRTNSAQEWQIYDNQRSPTNVMSKLLKPNDSAAEVDNAPGDNEISFLSNGFQLNEDNGGMNASGSSYIFAAWAEVPFGGADIAPATAR